jgi:DNA processing protein
LKFTEHEEKVLTALGEDERHVDEVIRATGLTSACVSSTLLALEMKRVVRQLPGKIFVRKFSN